MRVDWDNPVDMDHPLNRGLVAWWMAGEGPYWGGPLFRDLVPKSSRGGGNHGTLTNGPTWGGALGRPGGFGAVLLDNTDDYVSLGSTQLIAASTPFMLSWWEYGQSGSGTFPSRFRLSVPGGMNDLGVIRSSNVNFERLAVGGGANSGAACVKFAGAPTIAAGVGVWMHWTLIAHVGHNSNTPGDWTVVVDDTSYSGSAGGNFNYGSAGNSRIGYDGADSAANCLLDDIRVVVGRAVASEATLIRTASRQSYPQTLNRLRSYTVFDVGGGGATAFPWHYYQQMAA